MSQSPGRRYGLASVPKSVSRGVCTSIRAALLRSNLCSEVCRYSRGSYQDGWSSCATWAENYHYTIIRNPFPDKSLLNKISLLLCNHFQRQYSIFSLRRTSMDSIVWLSRPMCLLLQVNALAVADRLADPPERLFPLPFSFF